MKQYSYLQTVWTLALRNIKCYMRDKTAVFFSFLSPLIILLLYVLFLGDIQTSSILNILTNAGISADAAAVSRFVASWLVCGVLAVTTVTITLGASEIVVNDRSRNVQSDFYIAPTSKFVVMMSYMVSIFLISVAINLAMLAVAQLYLVSIGAPMLGIASMLFLIAVIVLSVLSCTFLVLLIVSALSSSSAFSTVSSLVGTLIGFIIGAYMPISLFPKPLQFLSNLLPASYTGAILKSVFMEPTLQAVAPEGNAEIIAQLRNYFSIDLYLGNTKLSIPYMLIVLAISVVLFMGLHFILLKKRLRKAKD